MPLNLSETKPMVPVMPAGYLDDKWNLDFRGNLPTASFRAIARTINAVHIGFDRGDGVRLDLRTTKTQYLAALKGAKQVRCAVYTKYFKGNFWNEGEWVRCVRLVYVGVLLP